MLRMMEITDLAGGALKYLDTLQHYEATLEWVPESKGLIHHEINRDYQTYDGIQYARADLTFNFFVAKTDLAREIRWEDSIQVIFEHEDFFMAGYQRGMKVVYCPNSIVTHRNVELPTTAEYEKIRWNRQDKSKFFKSGVLTLSKEDDSLVIAQKWSETDICADIDTEPLAEWCRRTLGGGLPPRVARPYDCSERASAESPPFRVPVLLSRGSHAFWIREGNA
jgi:hypothetical protein